MAEIRYPILALLVIVAACSKDKNDPVGGEEVLATQMIGAAGGTFSSAGVVVEVPPGAVAAMTTFEIRRVSGVTGPDDTSVVGDVYRLTPEDVTFATPVKVSLPVAGAASTDDLVLVRRGTEDADWMPIGGGAAGVTSVSGATSHFSWMALVRMAFEQRVAQYQPTAHSRAVPREPFRPPRARATARSVAR